MNGRTARALRRQATTSTHRYADRPRVALGGGRASQAYRGLKREYVRLRSGR